ncbi:hypothetical protein JRO89_XSUnG0050700 [Xanthoceras sorbifolium]|uniref:Uncharacterized protein n=1 Tax=Xanthoceras sorbifolium TaxID=99658 RepID=A0ABQ8GZU0_9ROSI|nr:hypothetical protein JRO89_XSUnG0050700 [Xanthoceras sorbifolium]
MFPISMAFNGVGNAVNGDYGKVESSMAFSGAGYVVGNAVSSGSDQLQPSTAFSGSGCLATNELSCDFDKFDYEFFCQTEYDQFFNNDLAPGNDIQQISSDLVYCARDREGLLQRLQDQAKSSMMAALHHSMTFQTSLFPFESKRMSRTRVTR